MNFTTDELRLALHCMSQADRAKWVASLDKAAANLSNAAYGLSGNVPDAQPDPETWSLMWLEVALAQIGISVDDLAPAIPTTHTPKE